MFVEREHMGNPREIPVDVKGGQGHTRFWYQATMKRHLSIGLFAWLLCQGFPIHAAETNLSVTRLIERIAPGH